MAYETDKTRDTPREGMRADTRDTRTTTRGSGGMGMGMGMGLAVAALVLVILALTLVDWGGDDPAVVQDAPDAVVTDPDAPLGDTTEGTAGTALEQAPTGGGAPAPAAGDAEPDAEPTAPAADQ